MDVPRHTGKERFSPPQQSNVLQNRNIFTDYNSYLSIGFNKNENTSHDWMLWWMKKRKNRFGRSSRYGRYSSSNIEDDMTVPQHG